MNKQRGRNYVKDGLKVCLRCESELPLAAFSPNGAQRANGYQPHRPTCKNCHAEEQRERRLADPDAHRARRRAYRSRNRDRMSQRQKEWVAANPEKYREMQRRYQKQWRERYPDRARAKGRKEQNRRNAGWDQEARDWSDVLRGEPCVYCSEPGTTIDHIVPLVEGGQGAWDNLAPTCHSCNCSKRHTPLLHFLLYRANWASHLAAWRADA